MQIGRGGRSRIGAVVLDGLQAVVAGERLHQRPTALREVLGLVGDYQVGATGGGWQAVARGLQEHGVPEVGAVGAGGGSGDAEELAGEAMDGDCALRGGTRTRTGGRR